MVPYRMLSGFSELLNSNVCPRSLLENIQNLGWPSPVTTPSSRAEVAQRDRMTLISSSKGYYLTAAETTNTPCPISNVRLSFSDAPVCKFSEDYSPSQVIGFMAAWKDPVVGRYIILFCLLRW